MSLHTGQDVVLFGGTGDLVMRKLLPALYHLHCAGMLGAEVSIIGVAREALDTAGFRRVAAEQCERFLKGHFDATQWEAFEARIHYVALDARDAAGFDQLRERLGEVGSRSQVY